MIPITELPTVETLDPDAYLALNADVSAAAPWRRRRWARSHFAEHGRYEGRRQFARDGLHRLTEARATKLKWLVERSPITAKRCTSQQFRLLGERLDGLVDQADDRLPVTTETISANHYDPELATFIDRDSGALLLDLGAGLRHEYRTHVVNVDIDLYASTDVVAFGEDLPFADATFDGAVCLAVLQHVADPLSVASELVRVVRPGGTIVADWAFTQPVNGYPYHHFNATPDGAAGAFRRLPAVQTASATVPLHFHPVFALPWLLDVWSAGLPTAERQAFEDLRIGDLTGRSPHALVDEPWVRALNPDAQRVIAAGSRVWVTKAR